jgi:hypothetical protein
MQDVKYIVKGEVEMWLPRPYKNRGERGTKKNSILLIQVLF